VQPTIDQEQGRKGDPNWCGVWCQIWWVSERVHPWVGGINHMRFLNVCASSCTWHWVSRRKTRAVCLTLCLAIMWE
jgi:hypothetical protein